VQLVGSMPRTGEKQGTFTPMTQSLTSCTTRWGYEQGQRITGLDLAKARTDIHRSSRCMTELQTKYDLILTPTLGQPPVELGKLSLFRADRDGMFTDIGMVCPFAALANQTGQPAMSVPLPWTPDGLPVGVQFLGRFGDEATLIRLAAQLEQAQSWADKSPAV
jgi:amidase